MNNAIEAHCQKRLSSSIAAVQQMRDSPTIIATAQTRDLFITTALESAAALVSTHDDYNEIRT